jgi:GntR family transcriptional regulator
VSPLARYEAIYRDLYEQIRSGVLKPGSRLPSEAALAVNYRVSRMTVRQALDQLATDRAVIRRKGSGTYAGEDLRTVRHLSRLAPFHVEMGLSANEVTTEIQLQTVAEPSAETSEALRLRAGDQAVRILRRRLIRGEPAAIQDSWLPYALVPGLAHESLLGGSLYETLRTVFGIRLRWAEQDITASAASLEQAEVLGVPAGSPLIAMTRITYTERSVPIEHSRSSTRPEYPLVMRLMP